ncbi:hypothetical protein M427DRAFT_51107 [Gonapodya prolifera JEL478]|uniref:Zn(2)-C6 fungal-type domain-containing protein n=1 Tax=Gonapodya prolifera (strain JEL478) TaxID=1344416 RepID=A0A139AYB5_GONPJ|nr:hypothetical protein M427DRAFT_51107 [Gonapodya prolifera JEL478]|eukprot:KXS21719.1 hypothetical protein M427DRAFT_51107 [Gonapodya prolifera JEL478]
MSLHAEMPYPQEEDEDEDDDDGTTDQGKTKKRKVALTRKTKACDACHRLKAKCAGDQPCERCKSLGEACTYYRPTRRRGPKVGPDAPPNKRLKTSLQMGMDNYLALSSLPLGVQPSFYIPTGQASAEFSAANIIHGLSRPMNGIGGYDDTTKWALPAPEIMHHLVVTMSARETFPTISHGKLVQMVADHAQTQQNTRPPALIVAAAALGAYELSRTPNAHSSSFRENGVGATEYYVDLSCHLLNVAIRCVHEEMTGDGLCVANGMFSQKGHSYDRWTVVAALLISALCSASTNTFAEGDLYSALAIQLGLKLGLNREESLGGGELEESWIEKEESRRIWWNIFFDSVVLPAWDNQVIAFTEEDVDLNLPCPDPLFSDPLLPPPDPLPFRLAFSLLSSGMPRSHRSPSSTSPQILSSSHPSSPSSLETLRTLFHSGRTGISGYTALLHGVGYRIMRLKRTLANFGDSAHLADAWASEEKLKLSGMLDVWYSALPDAVVEADRRAAREGGFEGVEPRSGVLFILYHTYKVLIYGRWDVVSMVYDDAWLMSSDFLLCVEHADRVTRLIELVTLPALSENGTVGRGAAEMVRWANPYVIGVAVLMSSFVHAAVLRKLRLVNPSGSTEDTAAHSSRQDPSSLHSLEQVLTQKIELHVSLVQSLSDKWGLRSRIWDLMREEFLRQKPGSNPSTSPLSHLNYGPGGGGLKAVLLSTL